MITVRFSGRTATPNQIQIGMETDQRADTLRFILPQMGEGQSAQLMILLPDETPEILQIREGLAELPASMTEIPGRSRAWVEILAQDTVAWNSELFYLDVGDLPPISERVEMKYPTAIQDALAASAEAEQYRDISRAMAEMILANGILTHIRVDEESETLIIDRASIQDEGAYEIAVENGFTGTQEEWNAYVEAMRTNESARQAQETAEGALEAAAEALETVRTAASVEYETIDITAEDWQGTAAPYTAEMDSAVATADNQVIVGIGTGLTQAEQKEIALACIVCTAQAAGKLTFRAYGEKPGVTVQANVVALKGGKSA